MKRAKFSLIGEIAEFDYHGPWGDFNSPKSLKDFLAGLSAGDEAEIEINSPGGLVIQGVEMANAIKNCPATIVAHVTGIAASMASVIACACDKIEMEEASFMMIHDPWGYAIGNAEEMRKQASVLDQMKAVCMAFYRGKFKGRTDEELAALMSEETWYTGAECKENGLECEVIKSDIRAAASIVNHNFAKIPEAAAKFLASKELTDEGRAEIEAAKAKAKAENPAPAASAEPAPDWEARYKGASKKINELQAKLDKATLDAADYGKVCEARDAAVKALEDFKDQVKATGYEDLAALASAVSSLKADLETSAQDLADTREQLEHLKSTRDLLTGGVLTQSESYSDRIAAAKSPEEREKVRAEKKSARK